MNTAKATIPPHIRELLDQADAALEKSRTLLRRARIAIEDNARLTAPGITALLAEITDLLGD